MAGMRGFQPVQAPPVYGPGGPDGGKGHHAQGDELAQALPSNKANMPWTPFDPNLKPTSKSWEISRKGCEKLPELKDVKSDPEGYKLWRQKIADHCSTHSGQWGDLLRYCRKRAFPIKPEELQQYKVGDDDLWELSKDLWNFLSNYIDKGLYQRRSTLAYQEGHGLRLWQRRL